jgi:cytochrome P450
VNDQVSFSDVPPYMRRVRQNLGVVPDVAKAREEGRVLRTPIKVPSVSDSVVGGNDKQVWLVTRYQDVRMIMSDFRRFSNDFHRYVRDPKLQPGMDRAEFESLNKGNLQMIDPPEHTRLRRLLMPSFTVSRMRGLQEPITSIVRRCLDEVSDIGPGADLVEHFALPIPSLVVCELLGVPYEERKAFQARARRQLDVTLSPSESIELGREARAYTRSLVKRAQNNPGDDLLGTLVREHFDQLDVDTLANLVDLILTAGHQTTSSMLALSSYVLLQHRDQLAWLRQNLDDVDTVETAIEELLRFISVVSAGPPRVLTEDVELNGTLIRAGELVVLSNLAANRDPDLVDDPDVLDLSRTRNQHLAFGHGAHHCLGASLARSQLRIAIPALLRRFPGLALAAAPDEVEFRYRTVVFGIEKLPVRW